MNAPHHDPGTSAFGSWLLSQVRQRGMTQNEFARAVGVSPTSVSRWINGDKPKGAFIERIADVLVLDYDLVATKAGYRPRELMTEDLQEWEERLLPLMRKVQWDDMLLRSFEAQLRSIIDVQRGKG